MRYPIAAGHFYPAEKNDLHAAIKGCFLHRLGPGLPECMGDERTISGIIAPHAGYAASGMNAAHAYRKIAEDGLPEAYIIIGPDHRGIPYRAVMCIDDFLTPLGPCGIHEDIASELMETIPNDCEAHRFEHSIEVQIPFIQFIDKDPKIVPIIMRDQSMEAAENLATAVKKVCRSRDVVIIASSDMSHYVPKGDAERMNGMVLERIKEKDITGMYSAVRKYGISVCGYGPMAAAMLGSGASRIEILKYSDSWDSLGYGLDSVVGYGSAAMYR
ncbi:MAG: AmmeMemoRadiSam system protein B [Candidatus Methanoplasma sp.]|jgi:AmmeMemoRadiSam system protein B|nr:AmmeMemoRadiSam system protein B [Candidatus Methanoplasma sp.]